VPKKLDALDAFSLINLRTALITIFHRCISTGNIVQTFLIFCKCPWFTYCKKNHVILRVSRRGVPSQVFWVVTPCSVVIEPTYHRSMLTPSSGWSETLVSYHNIIRRHKPEDLVLMILVSHTWTHVKCKIMATTFKKDTKFSTGNYW
jgi:hypothetical protein